MTITVEVPEDLLRTMTEAQLSAILQQEAEKLWVRKRYGDDMADAGATYAELQEARQKSLEYFNQTYAKDLVNA